MPRRLHCRALALALSLVLLVGACARNADQSAADAPAAAAQDGTGQANRPGSFLAYEHEVELRMRADALAPRVAAVRKACMDERFGACVVLAEEQGAGESPHGRLQVRAVPAAVDGLVTLAAEGAEIAQRSTRAEDLGDAIRDNSLRQRRLKLQHEKLSELAEHRDAKLEELVALTERLAGLEAELQQAEQEAATQQRRVNTNLLTLNFVSEGVTVTDSATRRALRGLGGIWDNSLATLVTIVGALLPFVLFALLVWALLRALPKRKKKVD
ncbi:MAG: DUF4349 domain-containing protein [Arenimonas sp.]